MPYPLRIPLMRCASLLVIAVLFAAGVASAQSTPSQDQSSATGYSSSQAGMPQFAELAMPSAPTPESRASAASGSGSGQYGNGEGYGGGEKHGLLHNLAFEAGGGFNAPAGDKTYITWGGQFNIGAGVNFNKRLAALIEYQFMDDKVPGAVIASTTATGGHYHIWSFTLAPVVDLFPKATNDLYVTGGGGFYRKVTSFTVIEPTQFCYYFYCGVGYAPQTVGHFSSNQGGFNVGLGYQHRMGGMYGDSKMKLFAEVRYLDVLSPAILGQSANGLQPTTIGAGTKVIPVSFGVRW